MKKDRNLFLIFQTFFSIKLPKLLTPSHFLERVDTNSDRIQMVVMEILRKRCAYLDIAESALELDMSRAKTISLVSSFTRQKRLTSSFQMLANTIGNKPFYFIVKEGEPSGNPSNFPAAVNHSVELVNDPNCPGRNLIEVRHVNMQRRNRWSYVTPYSKITIVLFAVCYELILYIFELITLLIFPMNTWNNNLMGSSGHTHARLSRPRDHWSFSVKRWISRNRKKSFNTFLSLVTFVAWLIFFYFSPRIHHITFFEFVKAFFKDKCLRCLNSLLIWWKISFILWMINLCLPWDR